MSESAAAPQTTAPAAEVAPVAPAAAPEAAPVATPAAAPAEPTEKPAEQAEAPTAEASSKPEAQTTEAQATEPVAVTAAPTEPVAVTAASTVPEAAPATEAEAPKEAEKAAEPTEPAPAAAAASVPAPAAEAAAPAAAAVPVPEAIPAPAEKPAQSGPVWPALAEDHPLAKFQARLPELLNHAGYSKIWGITLSAAQPVPFHTTLILQKFLRANSNNIDAAYAQLLETLAWRKTYEPDVAVGETFDGAKFSGLGYVTRIPTKGGEKVITWNLYGACKEPKKTFGDLDSFLRWRIALMELGVNALNLASATEPIPDYNAAAPGSAVDPYQMIQLHDYYNVSFFRLDGATKAASKKTIDVMARYYPELLSTKLFVNVPTLMGWVFTFMKTFLSKETVRKFQVVTSGKDVANTLGDAVPKSYGGQGSDLAAIGLTPKLEAAAPKAESVKSDKPKSKAASVKSAVPAEKPAAAAVVPVVEEAPVPAPPAKDVVVPEAAPEAPPKDDAKALPVVPAAAVEETPAPAPVEPAVPVAEETKPAAPVVEEPKPEVTTAPEDATKAVDAPAADAPKVPAVAVAEAVSEEKKPATTA